MMKENLKREGNEQANRLQSAGWLVGIALGILLPILLFPAVRYTLFAQLEMALWGDNVPWLVSLDSNRSMQEAPRLDAVSSLYPDDYLLQVGRATAFIPLGGLRETSVGESKEKDDHTLYRLAILPKRFPITPGAYAHIARYMMVERVRIQRPDPTVPISTSKQIPQPHPAFVAPRSSDLQLTLWALERGERCDSQNALWPTLLACTYFSTGRDDKKALDALCRASKKTYWDAYIYEEILGQWRLYTAAYGNHGATQEIGPLSLVIFPHLRELRRMAELTRSHAELLEANNRFREARQLRRCLARLGILIRDNTHWAFEALYGTDIFFMACTDTLPRESRFAIRTREDWKRQATQYLALLEEYKNETRSDLIYIQQEVDNSCAMLMRMDNARNDSSYPGIPPGIPLVELFSHWMAGICLIQQLLTLILLTLAIWVFGSVCLGLYGKIFSGNLPLLLVILLTSGLTVAFLSIGAPSHQTVILLLGLVVFLLVLVAEALFIWRQQLKTKTTLEFGMSAVENVKARWSNGTTFRFILVFTILGSASLINSLSEFSSLHPVAVLLRSVTGGTITPTFRSAVGLALFSCMLPLSVVLLCAVWGLYRNVSPVAAVYHGLRRLALPLCIVVLIGYALLLQRTLMYDTEASTAIQKAVQNDLQWVLTYGDEMPF